jgi:23S rRNA (uracil1939-C5)-methyltransferase
VIGVEANDSLLEHARRNARHNGIENVEYQKADLYDESAKPCWDNFDYTKLLLDPPRDGALPVIKQLPRKKGPQRIVYVSCNPVTLARDTEYLLNELGYRLRQAGVMDMFPHTNHVESIAVFER